jgi:hypothetical protein
MLLKEGIGWGYMPEPMVREDLETGRLVQLDMAEYKDGFLRLYAIHRTGYATGPSRFLAHCPLQGSGERAGRSGQSTPHPSYPQSAQKISRREIRGCSRSGGFLSWQKARALPLR